MMFSPSTKGWYPESDLDTYRKAKTLPEDLVKVTDDDYRSIMSGHKAGKEIASDDRGIPTLKDYSHNQSDT